MWLKELGAEITGLSLQHTSPNLFDQLFLDEQIHHHIGDIRDQKLLNNLVQNTKPNVVLHLAAQPLVQLSYEYPLETWSTNLMGTLNLLEALRQLEQDCTAVFITTDKVYRNNEWIYGYRENDPLGATILIAVVRQLQRSQLRAGVQVFVEHFLTRLHTLGSQVHVLAM